ncbi:MAG: dUTP diphosphatase [Bryobacteraceae bacterium]|nr:dUTP diphosphatase [Bryobacteraceae bacterium]MDW8378616.1 dUTP diphosphatase [Bryobacterales bacterium]
MKIRIKRVRETSALPTYAHGPDEDAGMDLYAAVDSLLAPGETRLVPTGISIELPPGYEAQIRPRSGLALKHQLTLPNSPATIDPGYRGEIQVIVHNFGKEPYQIRAGDRIAQLVIARYETVEWEEADLNDSLRGGAGFGSSGR